MVKPDLRNIWTPVAPIKRADNIVSSKAREQNNAGFKPSFAKDKRDNMWLVMSNGYHAQWFKERAAYERNTYYKWETIKQEKKVKRRSVQRMMTYRKPTRNDYLEEYVAARKDKRDFLEHCDYSYYKYKPVLLKQRQLTMNNIQKQEIKAAMPYKKDERSGKQLDSKADKSKNRENIREPKDKNTNAEDSQSADDADTYSIKFCSPCMCHGE